MEQQGLELKWKSPMCSQDVSSSFSEMHIILQGTTALSWHKDKKIPYSVFERVFEKYL